jgi:hypothetical protein
MKKTTQKIMKSIEADYDQYLDSIQTADYPKFSRVLIKAAVDEFDYAMGLADGTIIRFRLLQIVADGWVHIKPENIDRDEPCKIPYILERGIDINIRQIMWIADAPNGS